MSTRNVIATVAAIWLVIVYVAWVALSISGFWATIIVPALP